MAWLRATSSTDGFDGRKDGISALGGGGEGELRLGAPFS